MKTKNLERLFCSLIICIMIVLLAVSTASAATTTKTLKETKRFSGVHTSYGASVWGVEFTLEVDYDKTGLPYVAKQVRAIATMSPIHTYGAGDVIIAGVEETVDYGNPVTKMIKPTTSSAWSNYDILTNGKRYYSLKSSINKSFYYLFQVKGDYTFAVSNVFFANPNHTMTLSVVTPKSL